MRTGGPPLGKKEKEEEKGDEYLKRERKLSCIHPCPWAEARVITSMRGGGKTFRGAPTHTHSAQCTYTHVLGEMSAQVGNLDMRSRLRG